MSRDHRKIVAVDGRVAYVAGLGIGNAWNGVPAKGIEPWRDTGVKSSVRRWPTCTSTSRRSGRRRGGRSTRTRCRPARHPGGRQIGLRVIAARRRPRPACCASTPWSPAWPASGCGSPTPTSSACPVTCRPYHAPPRRTASTCGCLVPGGTDLPVMSPMIKPRATARCSKPACASSSGTGDASRQDRRGRRHLVASRVDQPQPAELDGQLGTRRRRRGRRLRRRPRGAVPTGPRQRHGGGARRRPRPPPARGALVRPAAAAGRDVAPHRHRPARSSAAVARGRAAAGALGLGRDVRVPWRRGGRSEPQSWCR